ncbi:MAG: ribonuclease PH [Gemmatimonadota bacterium]|nr:MAG: ribonuclease PH [Gemmatimonadota bacterium]
MARPDGRGADELRELSLTRGASPYAEGSCLARFGGTLVLCTASVQDGVPGWRRGSGLGWVTAEYAMLPRATTERSTRERRGAGGRTSEIQRLIGRSLRAALATFAFGERTITLDCDVLQADGGTRTAAITGGAVALAEACGWLAAHTEAQNPFGRLVAAVSVGVVAGEPRLDLSYAEDSAADVDANVVVAEPDRYVEVQGASEGEPFDRAMLDRMLDLAQGGVTALFAAQRAALR